MGPIKVDVGMNVHDTSDNEIYFQMGKLFKMHEIVES